MMRRARNVIFMGRRVSFDGIELNVNEIFIVYLELEKTEIRNKPDSVLNHHSSRPWVTPELQHPTRELLEQTQRSPTWACTS
jgi:hypothetical protein